MKIVFVNRYFYPDISATSQLLSDLAFDLTDQFEVVVVASRQSYDDPRQRLTARETVQGARIYRVWTSHFGRATLPGRFIDYVAFYLSAGFQLLAIVRRGDVVVALTDPPIISIPAWLVCVIKRARLINWLQDLFPETAGALGFGVARGSIGAVLRWFRDKTLISASVNVVLGERMAAIIKARGVPSERIKLIHNWSPGNEIRPLSSDLNPLRSEWGLGTRFIVGYSGNMGRAHELEVIIAAARRLKDRPDILFLFIGAGNQKTALEEMATRHGLDNVMFKPYQPRHELRHSLTLPDCHVVSLKPELEGLLFPSKLYSSLASGRPILFIGARDGEIPRLMNSEYPFGVCVEALDDAALARAVERLRGDPGERSRMGEAGRRLFEREFDTPLALASWRGLLARILHAS